ncbi:MAG: hypothetical protein M1837_000263 [Sclerophora amabilis]|nr:MAG: hypothetical protein M1837_000263 [Sclerophora amabilis]
MASTSAPSPKEEKGAGDEWPETGYFDFVAAILEARQHPIIIVEEAGLQWMGIKEVNGEDLDLLVRDSQLDDIVHDLLETGQYETADYDPKYRWRYAYAKQVPRLRYCGKQPGLYPTLSLWPESVYMISCDAPMVEVPDICAWNAVLMEDRFDPVGPDSSSISYENRQATGLVVLPRSRAQSECTRRPVYIPSIPVFINALLDQQRYRLTHPEEFPDNFTTLPSYHLSNFIRYLYLEKSYQRQKLLPELAEHNRADMETRLDRYKRKPLLRPSAFLLENSR